jgi:hypothetical protein
MCVCVRLFLYAYNILLLIKWEIKEGNKYLKLLFITYIPLQLTCICGFIYYYCNYCAILIIKSINTSIFFYIVIVYLSKSPNL